METLGGIALAIAAVGLFIWLTLRGFGIGKPGGKADCGCGAGPKCNTKGKQQ